MNWFTNPDTPAAPDASIDAGGYQEWQTQNSYPEFDAASWRIGHDPSYTVPAQPGGGFDYALGGANSKYGAGYTHEEYQPPEQTWGQWWDKNSSGQLGVDNAFRLGQVGLAGLGILGNLESQNNARKAHQSALNFLTSQEDPNSRFYRQRLGDIMRDRNGYLTDVVTQNKVKTLEDTLRRQATAQGRDGLSADDIRNLQAASSDAYKDERDTLIKLLGRQDVIDQARAELMAKAPTSSPIGAVLPGLGNIFNVGQEYAVSRGYASDPRFRTSQQSQQIRLQERNRLLAGLPPEQRAAVQQSIDSYGV